MFTATIRFYEELNDFLPYRKRKIDYPVRFKEAPSVKHIIEAEGVPHAEVDLILVNQQPVSFEQKIKDGDFISVYPVFESFDISPVNRLRPDTLRETRFILDVHLGKLARYLRMLGFDVLWNQPAADADLATRSREENRCILTRDKRLLMLKEVTKGYWIRNILIGEQVKEVISRFQLEHSIHLFTRCTFCNGMLVEIPEAEARSAFPGFIFPEGPGFGKCLSCGKIYWRGSHCDRFAAWVKENLETS